MIDKQEVWKHAIDVWTIGSQSLADLKNTLDQDVLCAA